MLAKFGRSLSDVTGKMVDILKDAAEKTVKVSAELYGSTTVVLGDVATQTSIVASNAVVTSSATKSAMSRPVCSLSPPPRWLKVPWARPAMAEAASASAKACT